MQNNNAALDAIIQELLILEQHRIIAYSVEKIINVNMLKLSTLIPSLLLHKQRIASPGRLSPQARIIAGALILAKSDMNLTITITKTNKIIKDHRHLLLKMRSVLNIGKHIPARIAINTNRFLKTSFLFQHSATTANGRMLLVNNIISS